MLSQVDWGYWNQMKTATILECVLLSIGRDPQLMEEHDLTVVNLIRDATLQRTFDQRIDIAINHITYTPQTAGLYSRTAVGSKTAFEILVAPFVAWAKGLNWDIPLEFTGFVPPAPLAPARNDAPPKVDPASAKQVESEDLKERERDNLHRIVGALLGYIKGDKGIRRHTSYKSETELINTLIDKYSGNGGVSERNLQKVFAASKQVLK